MKKIFYTLFLFAIVLLSACHKETKGKIITSPDVPGSTLDKIKDSVFLYCQEDYLWYSALPTYLAFQPRSYSGANDGDALTSELNQLSQYAIYPATGEPYEYYIPNPGQAKYSFIDNGQTEEELNGNTGDFGFGIDWYTTTDIRVTYVYPGSPAAQAGLRRGYKITSINNNTSLTYDHGSYGNSTNYNFVYNAYKNSNTISLVLQKPDGTSFTVKNLSVANYNVTPVLKDTTYTLGNGKVVGYIVFNSFTSDDVADPELDAAFANFATAGVTDLVVDLRYNGGGYVSTAQHLDDLIVPASKSGTLMYNTYYNNTLQAGKEVLLKNQWRKESNGQDFNYGPDYIDYSVAGNVWNFAKSGNLNVNNVYFIMTGHTASASELTINNLRPEMNVQFVGETSYGKPVGFFDIDINQYTMYTPEFYTENSANQGGYYQGFTPGTSTYPGVQDVDDMTKDFGDPSEGLLADILNYVQTGTYSIQKQVIQSMPSRQENLAFHLNNQFTRDLNTRNFTGMIMDKKALKFKKRH